MTITERTTTWGAAILFSRRIEVVFLILILGMSRLTREWASCRFDRPWVGPDGRVAKEWIMSDWTIDEAPIRRLENAAH